MTRYVVVAVALLVFSVLAMKALRLGVADLYSMGGKLRMEEWTTTKKTPPLSEWHSVENHLQTAIRLDPGNPHHIYQMVNLTQTNTSPQQTKFKERNRQSLELIRQFIRLQPALAFGWAKLSVAKFRAMEVDEEMWSAIDLAFKAAPNDQNIHRSAGKVSISTWKKIPKHWRPTIEAHISRAFTSENGGVRNELIQYAKRRKLFSEIKHLCKSCE